MESFVVPLLLIAYNIMNPKKEHIKEINDSRVFIVEDNDMHSLMMDYLLSKETTAHISKFRSGEECIEHLDMKPDVVILDYSLPGINGVDTFKEIKKYDPEVPVIVISGNKDQSVTREFLNEGVYEYIPKEDDAFEQVSKVTDSILNIMAEKEVKLEHRKNIILLTGVTIFSIIAMIIAYVLMSR